jgi:hypothetical protein
MKDFTHEFYEKYLDAIKRKFINIIRFDEYFLFNPYPSSFCIIRHDVDRKTRNALEMAKIEKEMGIKATYYFRNRRNTFMPDIIEKIAFLGHEIGYHYENLSDTKGYKELALEDFEKNIAMFRRLHPVKTISSHGRPLGAYNNLYLWGPLDERELLFKKFGILGDAILDIDYSNVVYISDTGRNWSSTKSNVRDKVDSLIKIDFRNGYNLYSYLDHHPNPKMVFQIHPERWSSNNLDYSMQFCKDFCINLVKTIISISYGR